MEAVMRPNKSIIIGGIFWLSIGNVAIPQISFDDITQESGLGGFYELGFGTAFLDFNNDGYQDIFVVGQGGSNKLYQNLGNLQYANVTSALRIQGSGSGWGVCYGDFDSDFDEDIYISRRDYNKNDLFVHENDYYEDQAEALLVADHGGFGYAACFAPLTKNLALDIVVANQAWPNGQRQSCRFFAGNIGLPFTDLTETSGIADSSQYWDCVSVVDYNNDNILDLLVSGEPRNRLYRNNGHGGFYNVSDSSRINLPVDNDTTGYGITWGDYNNDGWFDVYISYWHDQYGELFRNNGDGTFSDVTGDVGLGQEIWGHSTSFGDFDNDGWLDIYSVTGGYGNRLYRNNGGVNFAEMGDQAGVRDYHWCCGLSLGDIDMDGKLDMVVGHYADGGDNPNKTALFHNATVNDNNWVVIEVNGFPPNPDAIGARVQLFAGGISQIREVTGGSGFGSQNMLPLHFGIGLAMVIDSLIISYPNAQIPPLRYYGLQPNTYHSLPEITPDLASIQMISPGEMVNFESLLSLQSRIANVGNVDAINFEISCQLSYGTNMTRIDSLEYPRLNVGDTALIEFQPYQLPISGIHYAAYSITELLGDSRPFNDTASTEFYAGFLHDLACAEIVSPLPDSLTIPIIPCVRIHNPGISPEHDFPVICQISISDTLVYSEQIICDSTIEALSSRDIAFPPFTPSEGGSFLFKFVNMLPSDRNLSNDIITVDVEISFGPCNYLVGDINHNSRVNGVDVVYGVRYLQGIAPPRYICDCPPHGAIYAPADVNGTCTFNAIDLTHMVNYLKAGGSLISCSDCPSNAD